MKIPGPKPKETLLLNIGRRTIFWEVGPTELGLERQGRN